VEQEIDCQVEEGILEPVQFSQWARPVVPVMKKDGSVRLCGNYKTTVNQAARTDKYPLPRIEDMFASLPGGTIFQKSSVLCESSSIWGSISTIHV